MFLNLVWINYNVVAAVVGEYIGSTQKVMKDKINEAVGGVLFVDEAHRLNSGGSGAGSFKEEAMGVLVGAMTAPEYQDNILIVLAGYTKEMDAMLDSDPGLKRRIGRRVEFQNIDYVTAESILHSKLKQQGFSLEEMCHGEPIRSVFKQLINRPGWGNIGDIERLAQFLYSSTSTRLINEAKGMQPDDKAVFLGNWNKIYTVQDLSSAAETFLASRPCQSGPRATPIHTSMEFRAQGSHSHQQQEHAEMEQLQDVVAEENCGCDEKHDGETRELITGSNTQRLILDTLDKSLRATLSIEQIQALMKDGAADPNWAKIHQQATDVLQDEGIDELEEEIQKTMEESRQAHQESAALCAQVESTTNELEQLNLELENSALSAVKVEELERLKAIEEARLRSMVEVCGICYRLNTNTSGCGYRGYSPMPIVIFRESNLNC